MKIFSKRILAFEPFCSIIVVCENIFRRKGPIESEMQIAGEKITIRDIARWSGVSIATVSRVINGSAGVKPEIKARIIRSIEDCGWRCNNLKLRLQLPDPDHTVVLISSRESSANESGNVMRILADRCRENDFLPLSFVGSSARTLEFCRNAHPFAVVIYYWAGISDAEAAELSRSGIRTVAISTVVRTDCNCPFFLADPGEFMRAAAEELLQSGHIRIGYFGEFGEYRRYSERENIDERSHSRIQAIRDVLPAFSPEEDTVGDRYGDLSALAEVLRSRRHTAWICENLALAKQLYCTAASLGIRIPEDLSVVCFGHFNRLPPRWDFPLRFTTAGVDPDRLADRVSALLRVPEPPQAEVIRLRPLIESGDTVRPLRR